MSKIAVNEITNEAGTGGPTLPNGVAGGLTLGGDLDIGSSKITNGATGGIEIDAAGRVTMPYQPAFLAGMANDRSFSSGEVIIWNAVQTNTGGYYNSSNGRFTAPIAGRYFFNFSIWSTSSTTTRCAFYKNGGAAFSPHSPFPAGTRNNGGSQQNDSSSIVLTCEAGDYIDIRCYAGEVNSFGSNTFSGFLIG